MTWHETGTFLFSSKNYWFLREDHISSRQPIEKYHIIFFSDSAPHQRLLIILTLVNKTKPRIKLNSTYPQPENQNQNSPSPLICRYYCKKKNQRQQQVGRDPSLYLTAHFFSTFEIHKQVFLSLLYYYTTKIIEIQIHSQINFFLRESTATEREASPYELKVKPW